MFLLFFFNFNFINEFLIFTIYFVVKCEFVFVISVVVIGFVFLFVICVFVYVCVCDLCFRFCGCDLCGFKSFFLRLG